MNEEIQLLDLLEQTCKNFVNRKLAPVPSRTNVFTVISDQYQKENMHSDVLKYLLEFKTEDNLGVGMLGSFLDLLTQHRAECVFKNKAAVQIYRELGRIDVSLVDHQAKQAVIIENKINGASDPHKQLLRYYNYFVDKGYEVLGIVYLSLDGRKTPIFTQDWSMHEINIISGKMIYLAAYRQDKEDLYKNWLLPSLPHISDVDFSALVRQYAHLLQILNKETMDHRSLGELYEIIQQNNQHYKTAMAMCQMLKKLPRYIAERMQGEYQFASPIFPKIWVYEDKDCLATVLQDLMLSEEFNLTIDIEVLPDMLEMTIFERHNRLSLTNDPIRELLAAFDNNLNFQYNASRNRYLRKFDFPGEKAELDKTIMTLVDRIKILLKGQ